MDKGNKICILRSNSVNPDSRVEKEAEALKEAGYIVDIFCWDRECNHKTELNYIHNDTIKVFRNGHKAEYGAGLKSLKSFLMFQFSMAVWIFKNRRNYDAFHACDFDTAFFSYLMVRLCKRKFIFDIFDFLYGEPHNFLQKLIKKVQYYLINKADAVIICTENRREQIEGTSPRRLCIIHNTPSEELLGSECPVTIDKKRPSVVYVGILQEYRLLPELLNFFSTNNDIDFYIGGFGKLEKLCIDADRFNNIHYLGKLSYDQTLSLESMCDIMLAIYDPSIENHHYAAPNKFYESLMLGKPVIMVRGTGMSDEVEKNDIGVLIDYSEDSFAYGIHSLLEKRNEWDRISETMKHIYKTKYNWDIMKKRLADLYSEL